MLMILPRRRRRLSRKFFNRCCGSLLRPLIIISSPQCLLLTDCGISDDELQDLSWSRNFGTSNHRDAILRYEAPGMASVLVVSVSIIEFDSRCVLPDTFNECGT